MNRGEMRFILDAIARAAWLWLFAVIGWLGISWNSVVVNDWSFTWQKAVLLIGFSTALLLVRKIVIFVFAGPAFVMPPKAGKDQQPTLPLVFLTGALSNFAMLWAAAYFLPTYFTFDGYQYLVVCCIALCIQPSLLLDRR